MKKTIFALSTTLLLTVGIGMAPASAFADEMETYAYEQMGSVETAAVTGPIEIGGITYIPCSVCDTAGSGFDGGSGGGTGYPPLGTVETMAVTSPIEVGGIVYIPGA